MTYETIISFRWCVQLPENFWLRRVALPSNGKNQTPTSKWEDLPGAGKWHVTK